MLSRFQRIIQGFCNFSENWCCQLNHEAGFLPSFVSFANLKCLPSSRTKILLYNLPGLYSCPETIYVSQQPNWPFSSLYQITWLLCLTPSSGFPSLLKQNLSPYPSLQGLIKADFRVPLSSSPNMPSSSSWSIHIHLLTDHQMHIPNSRLCSAFFLLRKHSFHFVTVPGHLLGEVLPRHSIYNRDFSSPSFSIPRTGFIFLLWIYQSGINTHTYTVGCWFTVGSATKL